MLFLTGMLAAGGVGVGVGGCVGAVKLKHVDTSKSPKAADRKIQRPAIIGCCKSHEILKRRRILSAPPVNAGSLSLSPACIDGLVRQAFFGSHRRLAIW